MNVIKKRFDCIVVWQGIGLITGNFMVKDTFGILISVFRSFFIFPARLE